MNDILPNDIALLKQRRAEQDGRILVLEAKLDARERQVDYLQAQLNKLRRMNFGSRSENVAKRIAHIEVRLTAMQQASDGAPAAWRPAGAAPAAPDLHAYAVP